MKLLMCYDCFLFLKLSFAFYVKFRYQTNNLHSQIDENNGTQSVRNTYRMFCSMWLYISSEKMLSMELSYNSYQEQTIFFPSGYFDTLWVRTCFDLGHKHIRRGRDEFKYLFIRGYTLSNFFPSICNFSWVSQIICKKINTRIIRVFYFELCKP